MHTIALILAGGHGTRLQGSLPKQYLPIQSDAIQCYDATSILRRSIDAFLQHPKIDAVCVVIGPNDTELYVQATKGLSLLPAVIGGSSRQQSTYNGLQALKDFAPHNVLIHDAARPFVTSTIIDNVIAGLEQYEAIDLAVPVTDTIKSHANGHITLLQRDQLYATQTPQGFRYKIILDLHQCYRDQACTDDIALCIMGGIPINIVTGEAENVKITTQQDYAKYTPKLTTRVGLGYDIHRFGNESAASNIMLCGITIPCKRPVIAHSDGDVALHALTDAILGTIGAGDIGSHFPPSEPKWRNAASTQFVEHALALLAQQGGRLNNVDITIIAEFPKVGPYRTQMQTHLAYILVLSPTAVSIKATTAEGLGAIGRGEGIAAYAVCSAMFYTKSRK